MKLGVFDLGYIQEPELFQHYTYIGTLPANLQLTTADIAAITPNAQGRKIIPIGTYLKPATGRDGVVRETDGLRLVALDTAGSADTCGLLRHSIDVTDVVENLDVNCGLVVEGDVHTNILPVAPTAAVKTAPLMVKITFA